MKKLKYVAVLIAALTIGLIMVPSQSASASSYWNSEHWITLKKNVTVKKIKNVYPLYKSYVVKSYTAKKGSHYKIGHYGTNYSWVLYSGKFKSNSKYTYSVSAPSGSWYKKGIHKIKATKKYKSFHGYRVALSKSDYTYNTFYDTFTHATLADYRPTQKSKIIFKYGSHVYPTHHEWDWVHGNYHYVTDYHYKNGSWHKGTTTYVSD